MCDTSKNNWKSLAESCETFIEQSFHSSNKDQDDIEMEIEDSDSCRADWIRTSVFAYMKAMNHHLFNSRIYIAKLLDIISRYSKY